MPVAIYDVIITTRATAKIKLPAWRTGLSGGHLGSQLIVFCLGVAIISLSSMHLSEFEAEIFYPIFI